MKIDLSEDTISMFLGLAIVVIVGVLIVSYVRKGRGNVEIPGVNSSQITPTIKLEEAEAGSTYEVKKGDHLWKIAQQVYGDGYKWVEIAKTNKLENVGLLEVGQKLELPKITIEPKAEIASEYVVKKGDSLWNISVNLYHDGYKWVKLWEVNKQLIADPNGIEIGMKLATPRL